MGLLIHAFAVPKLPWKSLEKSTFYNAAGFIATGTLQNVFLAVLIFRYTEYYTKKRSIILAVLIILKILESGFFVFDTSVIELYDPIEKLPESFFRCFLRLAKMPMHNARISLAYVLPIPVLYLICFVSFFVALRYNPRRCLSEISLIAGQGSTYKQFALAFESTIHRHLPFVPGLRGRNSLGVERLSDIDACIASYLSIQSLLGFIFPLFILCAEEALSRKAFEKRRRMGPGLIHRPIPLLISYMGLLVIAVVLSFDLVVFVLNGKEWMAEKSNQFLLLAQFLFSRLIM